MLVLRLRVATLLILLWALLELGRSWLGSRLLWSWLLLTQASCLLDNGLGTALSRLSTSLAQFFIGRIEIPASSTVNSVPVVTSKDCLVKDSSNSTKEAFLATIEADMVCLTLRFLVGVHARLVGHALAREARLRDLGVRWEVLSRSAGHRTIDRWLSRCIVGCSVLAVVVLAFLLAG